MSPSTDNSRRSPEPPAETRAVPTTKKRDRPPLASLQDSPDAPKKAGILLPGRQTKKQKQNSPPASVQDEDLREQYRDDFTISSGVDPLLGQF